MTDKYEMPAVELPSAGKHGRGQSKSTGYKVEVRTTSGSPVQLGDFVIDNVWRALPIRRGAVPWGMNVPASVMDNELLQHDLVGRVAAEAHRWAFLASMEAERLAGALCIQTRLVKLELRTEYEIVEKGVSDPVGAPFGKDVEFNARAPFVNEIAIPATQDETQAAA